VLSITTIKVNSMKFLPLLLCLQTLSQASAASNDTPLFPLPAVDFSDLSVLDELAVSTVANALTTGMYQLHYLLATICCCRARYASLLFSSSSPSSSPSGCAADHRNPALRRRTHQGPPARRRLPPRRPLCPLCEHGRQQAPRLHCRRHL
jgi:hypothetical protein